MPQMALIRQPWGWLLQTFLRHKFLLIKIMKISRLPFFIILSFNLFTLLMYVISPYFYDSGNFATSVIFVSINLLALSFGYLYGERLAIKRFPYAKIKSYKQRDYIFLVLTIFYCLTFLIKYAYLLKFQVFDVSGMIAHLMIGVFNPKLGYLLSVDDTRQATVAWSLYFFTNIFNGIYFIVGFIYWKRLTLAFKLVFIFFLIVEIFYWVGRGTNFGIISLIIIFIFANLVENKGQIGVLSYIKYILLFLFCLLSFSIIMYSRSEGAVNDIQVFAFSFIQVDEKSFLFNLIPDSLHTTMLTIFFYLVQGYYNTSLAFDLDFNTSWMGGWNSSIQSLYSTFGFDFNSNTYIQRLEQFGIDPRVNWHSAYTWYANDFSFYGVPLVMYIIGSLIGFSWVRSVLFSHDLLSKIIFIILSSSSMLLFANNNFIGYYFYSLLFIFPYWIFVRLIIVKKIYG